MNNSFINEILAEWSMRSPDGLVGGHNTPENTAILKEILEEASIKDKRNPLHPRYFRYDSNTEKMLTKDHPLYDDGIDKEDVRNGSAVKKSQRADVVDVPKTEKPSTAPGIKDSTGPVWTVEYLQREKDFFPTSAKIIHRALNELSNNKRLEFLKNFDQLSAEAAVEFLNDRGNDPEYVAFLRAIDSARVSKGSGAEDDEGDASGSKAGRGEFILVLLIKGGKSAGSKSGDIILKDGSAIEVKEVKDKDETIRATKASLGGKFNSVPFVDALNELIAFCSGKEENVRAIMELAIDAGITNKRMPDKRDEQGNPVKITYDEIPEGERLGKLTSLKRFLNTADINNLNVSTAYALARLGVYIQQINKNDAVSKIIDPDKVEFDIGKQTSILKIDDIPPQDLEKIRNPENEPKQITVQVSSIAQEKRKAELIVPAIKRLKIFSAAPRSLDDVYTPLNIAKSMFEFMSKPPGHYTGGIVFYNSKSLKFTYEPDLTNLKNGEYYFQSYQQTGPTFTKQEPKNG